MGSLKYYKGVFMKSKQGAFFGFTVLVIMAIFAVTACDEDIKGNSDGNSNNGSIPSVLVSKWYSKASTSHMAFEITSAGKLFVADTSYDVSVSGNTVELKFGGTSVGTFVYAISGNEMIMLNGTGAGMAIVLFSPVVKSFTVTFDSNGGTAVPAQTVASGGTATEPPTQTLGYMYLDGWYTDNNTFQNKWNFSTNTVTADITLYARWIEIPPLIIS